VSDNASPSMHASSADKADRHDKPESSQILGSLGERTILSEILAPRLAASKAGLGNIGDDCAAIATPPQGNVLLVTMDPCPSPIIFELGDRDYWHYGYMTILINMSDIAAMGAMPIGITVSTVMPNSMLVSDYQRYLDGLVEASDEWGCPVIGGNIKDGSEFTSTGTALGSAPASQVLRRTGAREGDKVCVVGRMGLFWAAVLQRLSPVELNVTSASDADLSRALHRPVPRLREGQVLARSGLVTSCMDASDGVGACLSELAAKNAVDIIIDSTSLIPDPAVDEIADQMRLDPRKLMLAWGNWELVFSVRPQSVDRLLELARVHGFPISVIGEMHKGNGQVWLAGERDRGKLNNFASERFTGTSYFTHGLKTYMRWLIETPLTVENST
jgi:thiamine-monophosphate kinase